MKKASPGLPGNPLKITCAAGLVLALVISWCMVFFLLFWGRNIRETASEAESSFARRLREYDSLYAGAPGFVAGDENPEQIEKRLSALQKAAGSVEEHLSVLKRRRALALLDRRYTGSFAEAARAATEAYPYSAPLAVIAAEAALSGGGIEGGASPEGAAALLKTYVSRISQSRFEPLELAAHILAGNLDDPALAAGIPGVQNLLARDFADFPEKTRGELLTDKFLLLAHRGAVSDASLALNALLPDFTPSASNASTGADGETIHRDISDTVSMGAEFFYDHNEFLPAAEFFLRLGGDENNARAADALVLAGETAGARNIWRALSSGNGAARTEEAPSRQTYLRSLYNLAAAAPDQGEEASLLEKLFSEAAFSQPAYSQALAREGSAENIRLYSTIRYTRLLDDERAAAVLEDGSMKQNPLLDLELLRRKLEGLPPKRAAAEVWLLLGRHNESEALYEWAAWYFDRQKLFSETARLLREAEQKEMTAPWLDLHRGLALIREGKSAEAEKIFEEAILEADRLRDSPPWQVAPWQVYANMGRVEESRRSIAAALDYYQTAAVTVKEKTAAAQVQLRISRCLEALGRAGESRRALEYAVELDPENINIRREFRRFSGGR